MLFIGGYPNFDGFSGCVSDINASRYKITREGGIVLTKTAINFNDINVQSHGIKCVDECVTSNN